LIRASLRRLPRQEWLVTSCLQWFTAIWRLALLEPDELCDVTAGGPGGDEVAERICRIIPTNALVIHVSFEHVLGAVGVVLECGEGFEQPGAAGVNEKAGANAGGGIAARRHFHHCADALELIFTAAARNQGAGDRQLPAVWESFIHWCEQTREEFKLGPALEELLGERKKTVTLTKSYREWRRMQREEPTIARGFGFRDDPKKHDAESLSLSTETLPLWRPGHAMRGPASRKE
jgi:hypothetical protein